MEYTVDATGKKLGRLATEVATILMGKNTPSYERNIAPKVKVTVVNASKISIPEKKLREKEYERYSGYPGGLKFRTMEKEIEVGGYKRVIEYAVYGMLPGNKLRPVMMKNLAIND